MQAKILSAAVASVLAAVGLFAVSAASAGTEPHAQASRSCDISGDQTSLGASYVTSLKVRKTSCGKAKKVVKAYHVCRHKHGGRDGHCNAKVKGFNCNEGKRDGISTQYNAKVRCKHARKRVTHTYTQNT